MQRAERNIFRRSVCIRKQAFPFFAADFCQRPVPQPVQQIVAVHHGAFPAFHLAVGQIDHTVRQMVQPVRPGEAEQPQHIKQHFKMILLFAAHHINHRVKRPVVLAGNSRTDILRHINGSPVAAEQNLAVCFQIHTERRQIHAHRSVFRAEEHALLQSGKDFFLSLQVSLAFKINFIERNAGTPVRLHHPFQRPAIHRLPEGKRLFIALFPETEQFLCLAVGALRIFFAVFVEFDIAVADKPVRLDAVIRRRFSGKKFAVSQHRFTDMHAAVVDDIHLVHFRAAKLQNAGNAFPQRVVAQMPEVQRLVGIRAGKLHHDPAAGQITRPAEIFPAGSGFCQNARRKSGFG